jgi:PilZ domain
MSKTEQTPYAEKRTNRRAKMSKKLRVRPSDPNDEHFEDLPVSANVSKHGIYFPTQRRDYYKGMRLFVTYPFTSAHDPMKCEYLAEVVRVETLENDRFGIAIHLIMTV